MEVTAVWACDKKGRELHREECDKDKDRGDESKDKAWSSEWRELKKI